MRKRYWILGGTLFLLFLIFRFLLPLVLPFVLAYFCAKLVSPLVCFLTKRLKWKKKVSSILVVVVTVGAVIGFVSYVGNLVIRQSIMLLQRIPIYGQMADRTVEELCCRCDRVLDLSVGTSYQYVEAQTIRLYQNIGSDMIPKLSSYAMGMLKWVAQAGIGIFIFFVSTMLILLDESFGRVPEKLRPFAGRLKSAGLAYIKAQGIIIFIIAVVMSVGLMLMGNDYAVLFGIGIAVFDAFPVVGSGIVLVPWALIKIMGGEFYSAAILATLFVIATFLREILEPKLLGKELGMKPIYVLAAVYVGAKLFGVGGILLGPLALTVLKAVDEMISDNEKNLGAARKTPDVPSDG